MSEHESQGSHGSDCCNCVEGMAEKLKELRGHLAFVFEGNKAITFGTIKFVKDDSVLVMEDFDKNVFHPNGGVSGFAGQPALYISICAITEFIDVGPATSLQADAILINFRKLSTIRITNSNT
jgi:hypothetical protein